MKNCDLQQLPDDGRFWCPECDPKKERLLPQRAFRMCGKPGRLPRLVETCLEQHGIALEAVEAWYKATRGCEESRKRRSQLNRWSVAVLNGDVTDPKQELERLMSPGGV